MTRIYLDHNATTTLRPEAREAMADAMAETGNPSSVHWQGRAAKARLETAREEVAALVNAAPRNVLFTSGGTEANNLVLARGWSQVLLSSIEHDSVLASAPKFVDSAAHIPVDRNGIVDLDALAQRLEADGGEGTLVSIQLVNNETGAIQPVAEAARLAHAHGASIHTDAIQAAGKIPVDFESLDVDFLSLSAHKLGGPMGVGALIARNIDMLPRLVFGGGQEMGLRAGTENTLGTVGFAAAAGALSKSMAWADAVAPLREELEAGVRKITPDAHILSAAAPRVPNTSMIAVPGRPADTTVIALDLEGIAVSSGAACSSGKVSASHVVQAMGLEDELSGGAIRVSLGWPTTPNDVAAFLTAWEKICSDAGLDSSNAPSSSVVDEKTRLAS